MPILSILKTKIKIKDWIFCYHFVQSLNNYSDYFYNLQTIDQTFDILKSVKFRMISFIILIN